MSTALRRSYADTPLGQMHYAEQGDGDPLLLLHQTPLSHAEYAEVQPLLAEHAHTIAMDMYGFGLSAKFPAPQTIEQYASGAIALMDALGIESFDLMGHHTGSYVAVEVAAAFPARVRRLILSGASLADAAFRASPLHDVDVATVADDGAHLIDLWRKRQPFYPEHRPDLLNRFVREALVPGLDPVEGHLACRRYVMEDRVGLVSSQVLILAGTADAAAYPHTAKLAAAFTGAASVDVVEILGGMIPLLEQAPAEVAKNLLAFFARTDPARLP